MGHPWSQSVNISISGKFRVYRKYISVWGKAMLHVCKGCIADMEEDMYSLRIE